MGIVNRPRLMIGGTGSGCGKTTVTCGILKALGDRGLALAAFKCGPDYIDPMFHTTVVGTKSRNLDLFLCNPQTVKHLLVQNSAGADLAVLEGVMGLYDGLGTTSAASSNQLALVTDTPVVLVVNPKGMSLSAVAQIGGYLNFAPNNIQGIILNPVTKGTYEFLKPMIEARWQVKVYGYLPPLPQAVFKSRHLGLITAAEVEDLQERLAVIAQACEETLDLDGLLLLAQRGGELDYEPIPVAPLVAKAEARPRIGVARDQAFCFYYQDNLDLLEALGAELVYFSPLKDKGLPPHLAGLLLGGGYPEEYAQALSQNNTMRGDIFQAVQAGLPTIAECGGFLYLGQTLQNKEGEVFSMVGALGVKSCLTQRLHRFGYVTLLANQDTLLCKAGQGINAHEFHYSDSDDYGDCFTAKKANGKGWACIHSSPTLFAGYPHLHWWGNLHFAKNFVAACVKKQLDSSN